MAIKTVQTAVVDMRLSAHVDQVLADLDAGAEVSKESLRKLGKLLAQKRDDSLAPKDYLTDDERADVLISAIQCSESPLEQARLSFTQDFFADVLIPHGVRLRVARYLVEAFGVRGNPMWQTYVAGNFRFIDPQTLNED